MRWWASWSGSGARIATGQWVRSLSELPPSTAVVLDTSPEGPGRPGRRGLPARYGRALATGSATGPVCARWTGRCRGRSRGVRRCAGGPGPCTWAAPSPRWRPAEADVHAGRHPERPYCIVVQPGVADPTRAPEGHADPVGLLPRPLGIDGGHERRPSRPRSSGSPRASPTLVLARSTRTAAQEEAAQSQLCRWRHRRGSVEPGPDRCSVRPSGGIPTGHRSRACTWARPPRLRGQGSTGCAACTRPAPCSTTISGARHHSEVGQPDAAHCRRRSAAVRTGGEATHLRIVGPRADVGSAMMSNLRRVTLERPESGRDCRWREASPKTIE